MSGGFRAFRAPNYRLWFAGAVVGNTGTWIQRTAQDWLVLTVLTHHSGFAVGVTTGLQFAPLLLFSAHAGVLADRWPKIRVLMCTQTAMGLCALVLGLLDVTHVVRLWEVFVLAFVLGCGSAFDNPSRQAFVSEVVPRTDVTSAVSLNMVTFNVARLLGPGLAGLLIAAAGTGPAFFINAGSFVVVIFSLSRIDVSQLNAPRRVARGPGQVRAGLAYVRHRPDLMVVFLCTSIVATLSLNSPVTNVLMSANVFQRGPEEYGLLGSVMAIGALIGAVVSARRERPRLTLIVGSAAMMTVVMAVGALMPQYLLFALTLIPLGICNVTFINNCNTAVQLSTSAEMRGRVLALYIAVQQGTTPIGAPIVGWIGGEFGARWSVLTGAFAAAATAVTAFLLLRSRPGIVAEFDAAMASETEIEAGTSEPARVEQVQRAEQEQLVDQEQLAETAEGEVLAG